MAKRVVHFIGGPRDGHAIEATDPPSWTPATDSPGEMAYVYEGTSTRPDGTQDVYFRYDEPIGAPNPT